MERDQAAAGPWEIVPVTVRREAENPVAVDPEVVGPAMGGPAEVGPAGSSLSVPRPVAILRHSRRSFLSQECLMEGTITLSRCLARLNYNLRAILQVSMKDHTLFPVRRLGTHDRFG